MAKKKSASYDPGMATLADLRTLQESISRELGAPLYFGNDESLRIRHLLLGIPVIDSFLNGGLAFNRLTLLYGPFSSGKSVLAAIAVRAAQAAGLAVAWIDAEKSWNAEWASTLGVDPEQVIVTQPPTAEEGFSQVLAFVRAKVGLIVIDSLMALRPKNEFSGDASEVFDTSPMGTHAKMIGRGLMDVMGENMGTCIIAINQIRQKIGIVYGNPETIPGGIAQHHVAWQAIRVSRGEWLKEGTGKEAKRLGYRMRLRMEKNKQGAPFEEVEIPFMFAGYFDEIAGLVEMAVELGVVTNKPPMYYLGDEKFFGRGKLLDAFHQRPELVELVRKKLAELPETDL